MIFSYLSDYAQDWPETPAASAYRLQEAFQHAEDHRNWAYEEIGSMLHGQSPPLGMSTTEHIDSHPTVREANERLEQARRAMDAAQQEIGGVVVCVAEENLPKLQKKLIALDKKAAKLGTAPITLKLTDERVTLNYVYYEDPHDHGALSADFEHVFCVLSGEAPKIPGFQIIAHIAHTDAGAMMHRVPVAFDSHWNAEYNEIDLSKYHDAAPNCDHCTLDRRRKDTYVLLNEQTSEVKQIGRQCLALYTGSKDPERIAKYMEMYYESVRFASARGEQPRRRTLDFLAHCALMIRCGGYRKGDTKWDALNNLDNMMARKRDRQNRPMWVEPNADDEAQAAAVMTWAREDLVKRDRLNDFMSNVAQALSVDYLAERTEGVVAYAIVSYEKDREERAKREITKTILADKAKDKGWVGEEKQRLTLTLTLKRTVSISSDYSYDGTKPLYIFEDESGNEVKWFASDWKGLKEQGTYEITGTVKRHDEHETYGKSTVLTRCKVGETISEPEDNFESEMDAEIERVEASSQRFR